MESIESLYGMDRMSLMESGEMYLEALYVLSLKSDYVRAVNICEYLGYSKPAVSRAIKLLVSEGYMQKDKRGFLSLTQAGRSVAVNIYDRHKVLTDLFTMMGVDLQTADQDACRVEHYIGDKTFEAVKSYVDKHKDSPSTPVNTG